MQPGDKVVPGDVLGTVQETIVVQHKIMVPSGVSGHSESRSMPASYHGGRRGGSGGAGRRHSQGADYAAALAGACRAPLPGEIGAQLSLWSQASGSWIPFFPIAKGGAAAVPGPFGSGKTVVQHQLAKWAEADIVVYIGCGERGNEMTDVLQEFPELKDPSTGRVA